MTRTHEKNYFCSYIRYKFPGGNLGNVYKVRYQETVIRKEDLNCRKPTQKLPAFLMKPLSPTTSEFSGSSP